jgi:pimeloyl-ACP methyl ester carboxylesterase
VGTFPTDDTVAIVTGGCHGIGREIARALAGRDFAVALAYLRDPAEADGAVAEITAAGGAAVAVRADVTDELDVERLFDETAAAFGRVDVVVHGAPRGIAVVNRQAARRLRAGGAIVAISSAEPIPPELAERLRARDITVNGVAAGLESPGAGHTVTELVALLDHWQTKEAWMEASDPLATNPTIVLIHGLWMTPRSWEHWIAHYERKGYEVIAPAYPGLEVEVEALREDPSPIAALTVPDTVAHLEGIIRGLDRPPFIMGHSFGGVLTQILLDHGLGAAGVAIDSVPAEGIRKVPLSQIRASFPVLDNPANRHRAVPFTLKQFEYAFTNTLSEEESAAAYDRYHVAAPGAWVWGGVLANFTPGHQETWVNFHNSERVPLLFIAGGEDHIMPAEVNRSNAEHYAKSGAHTDYHEFAGRSHFTVGQPGWEDVADFALDWCNEHTGRGVLSTSGAD